MVGFIPALSSQSNCRTSAAKTSGLFECVGDLQNTKVVTIPAHDLNADR
jgi:hypothetical protein